MISPKIKYSQKTQKSALIVAQFFEVHIKFAFLVKNSQIFEEEYKITIVDKTLVSNI